MYDDKKGYISIGERYSTVSDQLSCPDTMPHLALLSREQMVLAFHLLYKDSVPKTTGIHIIT